MGNEKGEDSVMCGYGLSMVQNIRKRIGRREIYGESRYMKMSGLEWTGVDWTGRVGEHG